MMECFWDILALVLAGIGTGLVGHRFGRRHVKLLLADAKKTWEGSGAMLTLSAAVGTAAMLVLTAESWYCCLFMALSASFSGAYTKQISRGGYDTATVPAVNIALLLMPHFFLR